MTISYEEFRSKILELSKELEPLPTDIKVGSLLRFKSALERAGASTEAAPGLLWGSFCGLPVEVSPIVPEDLAVVLSRYEILCVIKLNETV